MESLCEWPPCVCKHGSARNAIWLCLSCLWGRAWKSKRLFEFFFFITHHSLLNFRHSSLITHHLKYPITLHKVYVFGTITQLIIAQIFQLFVGPIPVTWCSFYFFLFFFYLQPPIPKLIEPREKKKKNPANGDQWKKKKKKKERKN